MDFGGGYIAKVHWTFCQPGALPLGFPTPFGGHWLHEWHEDTTSLGEIALTERLKPSVAQLRAHPELGVSHSPGRGEPCGDPVVWANGWSGVSRLAQENVALLEQENQAAILLEPVGWPPPIYPRNGFGLLMCCGWLMDEPGNPVIEFVGQPPGFLLQENLFDLLQEDGGRIEIT